MSADELRSALASSVLAPSTLVWRDGMESWVPASSVPELGLGGGEPLAEPSTTDIGLPAGMRDDSSLMAVPGAPAGLAAGIPPPPALVARASQ
ncbi:MAG: DUF4339 domain-containing protein, partial [Polyangiales bacterium]